MKKENLTSSGTYKTRVVLPGDHRRSFILSPAGLIITLSICIFSVETLCMAVLEKLEPPKKLETLIDSTLLTTIVFAILYFYIFKPLVALIDDYKQKEAELKSYQGHLELMVQERTAELNTACLDLKRENEETYRARAALRESENRFRQIFEQSEDAIVLITLQDSAIIDVNPMAESIFHRQRAELLAGGLAALCDPAGCRQLTAALDQIILDNTPGMIEKFECTLPPGESHILSFHGKILSLQGSEVIYTTFRDITTRIQMEEQAREIQARLIQANRMTTLGTMVSSVAHEINNPNNFMLLNAGIIKQAWDDIAPVVEQHVLSHGDFPVAQSTWYEARTFLPDAIEGLRQGALRISDIVDNLKNYGQYDRFKHEAIADVNTVTRLAVSILSHHISSSTHRFTLELAEGLPQVSGNARQLEQVVINLIQNALLALPDPEHGIRVATDRDQISGQILITVSDEGSGIAPEIADRIMEPFFTTRLERGGTGLGLAISSTIVKENGGSIEFNSNAGPGTTFTVRLYQSATPKTDQQQNEEHHVHN